MLFSSQGPVTNPVAVVSLAFPIGPQLPKNVLEQTWVHRAALLNPFQGLFLPSRLLGSSDGGFAVAVTSRVGRAGTQRWPHSSLKTASNCDTWTAPFPSREPCRCRLELACPAGARRCPRPLIVPGLGRHSASVRPRSSGGRVLPRPTPLCAPPAGANGTKSQPARGPGPGAVSPSQDAISLPAFAFERGRRDFRAARFLTFLLTQDAALSWKPRSRRGAGPGS